MTRVFRGKTLKIEVKNPSAISKGVKSLTIDGKSLEGNFIPLERLKDSSKIVATLG